jgi:hypothetical protein
VDLRNLGRRFVVWMYGLAASRYEGIKPSMPAGTALLSELAAVGEPDARVLDVGAGTSQLLVRCWPLGLSHLDTDRPGTAPAHAPDRPAPDRRRALVAGAVPLPFGGGCFDLVVALEMSGSPDPAAPAARDAPGAAP